MALTDYSPEARQAVGMVLNLDMGKVLKAAAYGVLPHAVWDGLSMVIELATGETPSDAMLEEIRLMVMVELFPDA